MLIAYIDESKTAEKYPIIAVGGGLGTGLQWKNLLKAWVKVLKTEPDVDVFHTSDFETPEGRLGTVYQNWDAQRRKAFNKLLVDAVSQNQIESIEVATVKPDEYQAVAASRPYPVHSSVNEYTFCTHMLIDQIIFRAQKLYPKQQVTYYFEEGGPHQKATERACAEISDDMEARNENKFWRLPTFAPKDSSPGLQIADKFVYEAAKHTSHYFDDAPPEKHSMSHPTTGKKIWATRFPSQQWGNAGLDINVRMYPKEDIEDFFTRMESVR